MSIKYLFFGTFMYVFIAFLFPIELKALYVLNYITVLVFILVLYRLGKKPEAYFTKRRLGMLVFGYSVFMVFGYNIVSYFYTGNLYVFSEADAMFYHREAETMSDMSFLTSIEYYLRSYEPEDLGMVLVLSILYKIINTKILLSVLYVFVAVITANSMYGISRRFMSVKYAFLCAMVYCLSSYVIWFHSSGLKESLLVMLITLFYNHYYNLSFDKKRTSLWWLVLVPLVILLFRPVLTIFCIASVALGILLKRKLTAPQMLLLIVGVLTWIYFLESIISSTDKFLLGGTESMLEIKQLAGMVKGSVGFTYFVNILSSMFGPFPTIVSTKVHLSFYAPGLIFKVFVSIAFWFGLIHSIKIRLSAVYPMAIFVLLEMISLTYILEALELRKSIPHFPLVYIIAFVFIYRFDCNQLLTIKNHLFYQKSFQVLSLVLCALIIYWNFR
jgi:hypothetical protein